MAKLHYDLDDMVQQAMCLLDDSGREIKYEKKIDYGYLIKLTDGAIFIIYSTGRIVYQGEEDISLQIILKDIKKRFK